MFILLVLFVVLLVLELLSRWVSRPKKAFNVKDSTCVITGGSSGLGLEIARQLLERGARKVILIARDEKKLKIAREELAHEGVFTASVDVCDFERLKEEADKIGQVDYLFCCAGASEPGFFLEQSPECFARGINLNYLGSVHACKAFSKNMMQGKGGGKMVLISSTVGAMGLIGYSQYAPTKFAVRGLAECLRGELRPMGIDVHVYFVGTIDTPGYALENQKKPLITKQLEGAEASDPSPRARAHTLLEGLRQGEFAIYSDLLTRAIRETNGLGKPSHNIFLSILFGLLSPIAGLAWTIYSDYLIGKSYCSKKVY